MGVLEELTDSQIRAVEAEAPRVCVAAGPGAGKTRVLVERVVYGVEKKDLEVRRVLALTFTNNAAAEMKERLAQRFRELERKELARQVEQAYVSTIHGFCDRLLREHAIEAGVDPRFRVLDETEANLLKSAVLSDTLNRFRESDPEGFAEFARHFTDSLVGPLLEVYDEIRRLGGDPQDPDSFLIERQTVEDAFQGVQDRLGNLEAEVKRRRLKPEYSRAVGEVQGNLEQARRAALLTDALAALEQARECINFTVLRDPGVQPSFRVLRAKDDDLDRLKELGHRKKNDPPPQDSLLVLGAVLVEQAAAPQRRRAAGLLAEFHSNYQEHKRRISALDFEDLERRALDFLSQDGHAAAVARRFQEILVDEYQDTSDLQARLLERLADGPQLFLVGDRNQSIYAFRNAEPENFHRAEEKASQEGRIPLREDFRSRPEIIAAVNSHFRNVWSQFEPLETDAGWFAQKDLPSVEALVFAAAKDEPHRRYQEGRHLARRIRELIEGEKLRITKKKDKELGRTLAWGDVAILFRSTTDMAQCEMALADEGVPSYAETGRGFYDAREVADVVNFLRVLDNARDEIALAAVLRSPMFGLSDDALYLLAARAREQTQTRLADALAEAENLALPPSDLERVRCFRALFARLREEGGRRPLPSLVLEIVAATDYESILMRKRDGMRGVANLRKLAEVARTLSAAAVRELDSPGSFVRAVDQFRTGEVREGEAQLVLSSENAVRLMTMHAAKGLEFPVVVLPDLGRSTGGNDGSLDFHPEYGLGVEYQAGVEDRRPTHSLLLIRSAKKARDDDEDRRVLYVAMTRAQEHLVLSASGLINNKGECGSLGRLDDIWNSCQLPGPIRPTNCRRKEKVRGEHSFELSVLVTDETWPRPVAQPGPAAEEAASRPAEDRQECLSYAPDQSDFAAAVTDILEFHDCPRRYYLGRYLGFEEARGQRLEAREEDEEPRDEFPATELGSAVHSFLSGAPGPFSAEVVEMARRFRESELGRRVAAMKDVEREEPIYGAVEGRYLRGRLDLHAGPLIVDYKTGKRDESHRLQMLLYALLTGAGEAVLFYLADGQAVPVELTPEGLEEARAAVRRFFDAQSTLDFSAVVEEHCWFCPFSGSLCREPQKAARGTARDAPMAASNNHE